MIRRVYLVPVLGQTVPEPLATELRRMRTDHDARFGATLYSANRNGWTLTALGNALGVTREAIRARLARPYTPYPSTALPHIPLPPQRTVGEHAGRRPPPGPDDPRHGTPAGYAAGCHCQPCRDAINAWHRLNYARRTGRTGAS